MNLLLIFSTAANAVLPVVLTILVGYVLKQMGFLTEEFTRVGYKLVFNLLLPVMLFLNVYDLSGFQDISWGLIGYCVVMVLVLFCLGFACAVLMTKDPACRGTILQASFRSNMAVIGIPLATALGDDRAAAVASMLAAVTIVEFNVLAVLSFSIFAEDKSQGKQKLRAVPRRIARNPLILGICCGLLFLLLREGQKMLFGQVVFSLKGHLPFVYATLKNLKSIATPFALVVLGGQFVFSAVKHYQKEIVVGTLLRILVAPLLGIGIAALLQTVGGVNFFGPQAYPALIALFGSPVAVSSAIMASQMGGDETLATQLTVWTSVGSIFTVFAAACILMAAGFI